MKEKKCSALIYHRKPEFNDLGTILKQANSDKSNKTNLKLIINEIPEDSHNAYTSAATEVLRDNAKKYDFVFTDSIFIARRYKHYNPSGSLVLVGKPDTNTEEWLNMSDYAIFDDFSGKTLNGILMDYVKK